MKYKKILYRGKQVGLLREDRKVFRKTIFQRHIFKKFNGVGISLEVLKRLEREGVQQIRLDIINDKGVLVHYRVSLKVWFEEGIQYMDGDDVQLILPFAHMYRYDVMGGKKWYTKYN